MNDKQILADLYDVLSSQQRLLSFIFKNHHALVETLLNESTLKGFADRFQSTTRKYASKYPKGDLFEVLSVMQSKLDAIDKTLKKDKGGWHN